MAPTGAGKLFCGLMLVRGALDKGKRALFVCDRITLIDQASAVADSYGLNHGVIQADHPRKNDEPFQICSAQTLLHRGWPEADICVWDECHVMHKTITDYVTNTKAAVIGLSATPFAVGLGDMFTNLINAATMHELIESGILVPMRVFACTPTNMKGAETSGGEWTDRAAEERGLTIVGNVVSEWKRFGENRKTICFGATINHCDELARQFNSVGVVARTFTAETKKQERDEILQEYRKPDSKIRVLLSVEALSRGFDVPDVLCVIDCRPLRKSLSTFMQMIGRGMRSAPGKTECYLLSHSGNVERFAQDFEDIYFNGLQALKSGERLDKTVRQDDDDEDKKPSKGCPNCGHKPFYKRCISCGHEHIIASNVEILPGTMREITIGKRMLAMDHKHLWQQVCTYARKHAKPGRNPNGRAYHLFQAIAKTAPDRSWKFESTPDVPITAGTAGKIRSLNIAFIKSRRGCRV